MTIEDVKISEEAFYYLQENNVPDKSIALLSQHIIRLVEKALSSGEIDFSIAPHDEHGNIYLIFISIYSANKDVSHVFKVKYGALLNKNNNYKIPEFIGIQSISIVEGQDNILDAMNEVKNKKGAVYQLSELDKSKESFSCDKCGAKDIKRLKDCGCIDCKNDYLARNRNVQE
jgi:hypothetical protein